MFVFALSFFSVFSSLEDYRLAKFMLDILRCLRVFTLPKANRAKKLKMPGMKHPLHLCHLPLCCDCMCKIVRKCKRER